MSNTVAQKKKLVLAQLRAILRSCVVPKTSPDPTRRDWDDNTLEAIAALKLTRFPKPQTITSYFGSLAQAIAEANGERSRVTNPAALLNALRAYWEAYGQFPEEVAGGVWSADTREMAKDSAPLPRPFVFKAAFGSLEAAFKASRAELVQHAQPAPKTFIARSPQLDGAFEVVTVVEELLVYVVQNEAGARYQLLRDELQTPEAFAASLTSRGVA